MQAIFPVMPTQYMGDYHFSHLGAKHGWPTVVVREFVFTHHLTDVGRLHTLRDDYERFLEVIR